MTRLMPGAAIVIVLTRWHEDDLVGRILNHAYVPQELAAGWEIISLPALAEANDPLGREPGQALWPEWYNEQHHAETRAVLGRDFISLYQQRPTPEEGSYFRKDMLRAYAKTQMPPALRYYGAFDHALSVDPTRDASVLLIFGVDADDVIYLVDCFWGRVETEELCGKIIDFIKTYKPLEWFPANDNIFKSFKPFLDKRIREESAWRHFHPIQETRNLEARAQSIRERMSQGMVRFPNFAPWYAEACAQILTFPSAKHDDFIAALSLIGLGMDRHLKASTLKERAVAPAAIGSLRWIIEAAKRQAQAFAASYSDASGQAALPEGLVFTFPPAASVILDIHTRSLLGLQGTRWLAEKFYLPERDIEALYGVKLATGDYQRYSLSDAPIAASDPGIERRLDDCALVYEVWDRERGAVETVCDGYRGYLRRPSPPTVRVNGFFPYHALLFNDVACDRRIYPPSDVSLLRDMQLDTNLARQGVREHRIANRPRQIVRNGAFEEEDQKKLAGARAHDVIIVNAPGDAPLQTLIEPVPTIAISPELYSTAAAERDMLLSVGSQEANIGPVSGATALEIASPAAAWPTVQSEDYAQELTLASMYDLPGNTGACLSVIIVQDNTGNRSVTFEAYSGQSIVWDCNTSQPAIAIEPGEETLFSFYKIAESPAWKGVRTHKGG